MQNILPKLSHHFFSLIVPVHRQEKTIAKNLRSLKRVLDRIRYDYEIIAVIDGKHDKSFEKIKKAQIKKIKTVLYNRNFGKAYAIRLGMTISRGDYVMFIDSGMEIDPNGISMLLEHMEWYDADIIVGSKRHLASQVEYPVIRKILSDGYSIIVKLLFGIRVHDTQAGIKIFKKRVLQKILPRLVEKKFAGDLEILVVARHLGFKKVFEAPIKLNYNASDITSAATLKSIIGILVDTFAIFYRCNILKYYNKPHNKPIYPSNFRIYTS